MVVATMSLSMKSMLYSCILLGSLLLGFFSPSVQSFGVRSLPITNNGKAWTARSVSSSLSLVKVEGYDEAFRIIDEASVSGTIPPTSSIEEETDQENPTDGLYEAVRVIDRQANKIYPTVEDKEELWATAKGSWKLQFATGGGKKRSFKSLPIFAFAMIDDVNFGNGVGINSNLIGLSLLGPHIFSTEKRQMVITIDDAYVFGGNKVTSLLPDFVKEGMGLGKKPEEFNKAPAFTFIGASDKSLIARGGTGGIAIWTRLDDDIRPSAYKE